MTAERPLAIAFLPRRTLAQSIGLVLVGTALLAVSAQVRLPLPFTPVPLTGQTFAVLFLGAVLGSAPATSSAGIYWAIGACGLPVFNGGSGGWAAASGPTGGYLAGMVAAAFVVGWFAERGWCRDGRIVVALLLGEASVYICGLPWLGLFVGPRHVLQMGLFPFLAGDALKMAAVSALLPGGWQAVRRFAR
jgi:biotin transport system substrate-specific component